MRTSTKDYQTARRRSVSEQLTANTTSDERVEGEERRKETGSRRSR